MLVIWVYMEQYVLLFARIGSFLSVLPVMGNRSVPVIAKIGLAGFLAFFMYSASGIQTISLPATLLGFILVAMKEVLIGLGLGFLSKMLFAGVQMAGELAGRQIGFAMARTFDPTFQTQASIISEFYMIIMMLIYLILSGHHFLLEGLADTYRFLPIGGDLAVAGIQVPFMKMASGIFVSCIRIAAPVLATLMLTNIALGILARTVPQMNVFMVGLPLRIGLGLIAMVLTIDLFVIIFQSEWAQFKEGFAAMLHLLGG
ncbi:flagellar biosynthetic protein FliR [bacterium]|nr:flagellar biosynthetic protein FliR [bacterium]